MANKIIVIEGTDCSGKETQTKLLIDRLLKDNVCIDSFSFPNYNSPTGKIVGGPYLGKESICDGWFPEGASSVDPYVAMSLFGADRRYNLPIIMDKLKKGHLLLDRYVFSNMAHQACKAKNVSDRNKLIDKIYKYEFDILELPKPDIAIFLYMPYEYGLVLKNKRDEKLDQHEASYENQVNSISVYLYLSKLYNFIKIDCVSDGKIRSVEDINDEIYSKVRKLIK